MFLKALGPDGSVYLLKSEKLGFYKIGYTRRGVRERTRQLNEEMDVRWEVVSNILTETPEKLERYFHKSFEHRRVLSNREWFVLSEDEVNLFVRLAQDQRWIRERASEAARKEERACLPDWIRLVKQLETGDPYGSLVLQKANAYYHPSSTRPTVAIWFSPEDRYHANDLACSSGHIDNLRDVLVDAWKVIPDIEIRVTDEPEEELISESGELF